jgi:hypothetical protein
MKRIEILVVVTEVIYLEDNAPVNKIKKHLKKCVKRKKYPDIGEEDGFKECEYRTGIEQELYLCPENNKPFIQMFDDDKLIFDSDE